MSDAYVPGIRVNADDPNFANLTTTWFQTPDRDIAFQMDFGPTTPVATTPEPGTWALPGTGLVGVAGAAARRRRAV
ncbi:PEP-CTERM sorting domain-containing protein [Gemmatirosa kalamazoonensis]|uniref:PEP-CTERM sorting domain-containing protein n=1 Tax=Gemmatirosa kalamazoonensis TaxID=861299 RepID=UPI00046CA8A6|nr:PEP-CTERM sorting domain-containing protein [Gemmatirosa kalamazoonensis]